MYFTKLNLAVSAILLLALSAMNLSHAAPLTNDERADLIASVHKLDLDAENRAEMLNMIDVAASDNPAELIGIESPELINLTTESIAAEAAIDLAEIEAEYLPFCQAVPPGPGPVTLPASLLPYCLNAPRDCTGLGDDEICITVEEGATLFLRGYDVTGPDAASDDTIGILLQGQGAIVEADTAFIPGSTLIGGFGATISGFTIGIKTEGSHKTIKHVVVTGNSRDGILMVEDPMDPEKVNHNNVQFVIATQNNFGIRLVTNLATPKTLFIKNNFFSHIIASDNANTGLFINAQAFVPTLQNSYGKFSSKIANNTLTHIIANDNSSLGVSFVARISNQYISKPAVISHNTLSYIIANNNRGEFDSSGAISFQPGISIGNQTHAAGLIEKNQIKQVSAINNKSARGIFFGVTSVRSAGENSPIIFNKNSISHAAAIGNDLTGIQLSLPANIVKTDGDNSPISVNKNTLSHLLAKNNCADEMACTNLGTTSIGGIVFLAFPESLGSNSDVSFDDNQIHHAFSKGNNGNGIIWRADAISTGGNTQASVSNNRLTHVLTTRNKIIEVPSFGGAAFILRTDTSISGIEKLKNNLMSHVVSTKNEGFGATFEVGTTNNAFLKNNKQQYVLSANNDLRGITFGTEANPLTDKIRSNALSHSISFNNAQVGSTAGVLVEAQKASVHHNIAKRNVGDDVEGGIMINGEKNKVFKNITANNAGAGIFAENMSSGNKFFLNASGFNEDKPFFDGNMDCDGNFWGVNYIMFSGLFLGCPNNL